MIVLNVIAWIVFIISIFAYTVGTVMNKTMRGRVGNFVLLLGYIFTLIAYLNKESITLVY